MENINDITLAKKSYTNDVLLTSRTPPPFAVIEGKVCSSSEGGLSAPASVQTVPLPAVSSPQAIIIAAAAPPTAIPNANNTDVWNNKCSNQNRDRPIKWDDNPNTTTESMKIPIQFTSQSPSRASKNGVADFPTYDYICEASSSSSTHPEDNISSGTLSDGASSAAANALATNDDFIRRFIEEVKKEPCLYNPNHEHYGNKQSSSQIRAAIWQNLCKKLDYPEDAHSLHTQWKRVRDRYVRERRKRKITYDDQKPSGINSGDSIALSAAARHFDSMRWIDEYLSDVSNNTTNFYPAANETSTNSVVASTSSSVMSVNVGEHFCGPHPNRRSRPYSSAILSRQSISSNHLPYYEVRGGCLLAKRPNGEAINDSPSSTSSEPNVGSVVYNSAAPPLSQFPITATVIGSSIGGAMAPICSSVASNNGEPPPYQLISVPAAAASTTTISEQVMTMLVDPNTGHFIHAQQNLSSVNNKNGNSQPVQVIEQRQSQILDATTNQITTLRPLNYHQLNNSKNLSNNSMPPRRKRMALQAQPTQVMMVTPHSQAVILEHRQTQSQMHVQQHHDTRTLQHGITAQQLGNAQHDGMLHYVTHPLHQLSTTPPANSNVIRHLAPDHAPLQQQQNQQQSMSQSIQHTQQLQPYLLSAASTSHHTDAVAIPLNQNQNTYQILHNDAVDAALVETIVNHFANLNDDEKVVTKMNIQRILMDARFGRGACVRMFREEENSENLALAAVLEQQQQQQHSKEHHQHQHQLQHPHLHPHQHPHQYQHQSQHQNQHPQQHQHQHQHHQQQQELHEQRHQIRHHQQQLRQQHQRQAIVSRR